MSDWQFAHPNDLDAERRICAVLMLCMDDQRCTMLERIYEEVFVHPFFRWLFANVLEIHRAGHTEWSGMIRQLTSYGFTFSADNNPASDLS